MTAVSPIESLVASLPRIVLTRADVEKIVESWQEWLALTHWEITIEWDKPLDPEQTLAEIDRHGPYDYAKLRLARDWQTWSREWAAKTIVHELMHLHARDLELASDSLDAVLDESAKALWRARFEHEIEKLVDKTATLFVSLAETDD